MNKANRAALMVTLEQFKPSGILVTMGVMILAIVGLAMYLATDETVKTEEFIGTMERLQTDTRGGDERRYLVVKVATGESISIPIEREVEVRPGAEVRLSRGVAGGGRLIYQFIGYVDEH